jgi:hypothetical protein
MVALSTPGGRFKSLMHVMLDSIAFINFALTNDSELSELEVVIASIWNELLGVEIRSSSTNYVELGANSLVFILVRDRLREICGLSPSLKVIRESGTIRQLTLEVLATKHRRAGRTAAARH